MEQKQHNLPSLSKVSLWTRTGFRVLDTRSKALDLPSWLNYPPLLKLIFPRLGLLGTLSIALVLVGLIALSAQIRVPLGFTPVPITLQTLVVVLAGGTMGLFWGGTTVFIYIVLGAVGLPFFSFAEGGIQYFAGSTGGYIVGFLVSASLVGFISQRYGFNLRWALLGSFLGLFVVYLFGIPWLAISLNDGLFDALQKGLYPFLVGDAIKFAVVLLSFLILWQRLEPSKDN